MKYKDAWSRPSSFLKTGHYTEMFFAVLNLYDLWPWPYSGGLGDHELCPLCWKVCGDGGESVWGQRQASSRCAGSCSPENNSGL